ncbi:MAG TPA: class I SAM-dependent methyltransferase, partial [Candidatus Binataceae bacterium]
GYFSDQILRSTQPATLHLIDIDLSQILYDKYPLQAAIGRGVVKLHEGKSAQVLSSFPDHCLDWIYIDGDHSYQGVMKDIEQAVRVVKPDGLLIFNDYTKYSPLGLSQYGVMEAVNELCITHDYEMTGLALHGLGYHDVILKKML